MARKIFNPSLLKCLILAGFLIEITACRSKEAEQVIEIPSQYSQKMTDGQDTIGMQKSWIEYGQIMKYDKIMINVNVSDKIIKNSGWDDFSCRKLVASKDEDNAYIANYTKTAFIDAFKTSKHLELVDKPGPKTLKLDFIIVQIVPNKPIMGGLTHMTTLTPFGFLALPLKMSLKSASGSGGGAIAMETIITDSKNRQILAVFASREKGATSLFSTKDFTGYGTIRSIVEIWAKGIVTVMDGIKEGKKDVIVEDRVRGFKWVE